MHAILLFTDFYSGWLLDRGGRYLFRQNRYSEAKPSPQNCCKMHLCTCSFFFCYFIVDEFPQFKLWPITSLGITINFSFSTGSLQLPEPSFTSPCGRVTELQMEEVLPVHFLRKLCTLHYLPHHVQRLHAYSASLLQNRLECSDGKS